MTQRSTELEDSNPPERLRSLEGELVALIARQARRVRTPMLLSSAAMTLLLLPNVYPAYALAWLAWMVGVVIFRTRWLVNLPDDGARTDAQKLEIASRVFVLGGVSNALLLCFFPFLPIALGAMLSLYITGMSAGTLPSSGGHRRIVLPYTLVTMGPMALLWALSPNVDVLWYERAIFLGSVMLYVIVLLRFAEGTFDVFKESCDIRLQGTELNQQLREALRLAESANRAKTRFLASASHDLRQPIHALALFSGSLLLRPLDPRTTSIAEQIDKAVTVLASQLDALLDISRLDAGVIETSISTVDLRTLIDQLAEEFRGQAERKRLNLRLRCNESIQVRTDPVLIHRVLSNLLSNAIKYTEIGLVELLAEKRDGRGRVQVRDSGRGIPEAEQEKVFEEFYQLANPERDRSKGLGLGLAIVRRLTELMRVPLVLESTPGRGTRIYLDLPLAQDHELAAVAGDQATALNLEHADMHILVVDDEEAVRVGMTILLEELGFSVEAVGSTLEAMSSARTARPALVLADFRLRGEDNGMHAISSLRALWPDLPALLISGDTEPDRLREAHDAGIVLLHKPVSADMLRESITKITAAA